MGKYTNKQYMDLLIKASGSEDLVKHVKRVMKKDRGVDGLELFFSNMPKGSFGLEKGDIADETIYFRKPDSKEIIAFNTKRAMSRAPENLAEAKLRARKEKAQKRTKKILDNMDEDLKASFLNLSKSNAELNKNKGGVVTKKTKGYTRGGLTKMGHNDMRKEGFFR